MALSNNILRAPILKNGQDEEGQPQSQPQQNLRTITIDPIKYAHKLPIFDGSPTSLNSFIDAVDTLVPVLRQYDVPSQQLIANIIKTKIIGKAQLILNINSNAYMWSDIRKILVSNFSDKKSSYQLLDELKSVTFRNTVLEFYNEIQEKLQNLNTKCKLKQKDTDIESTKRIALDVLKHKIIEPVRSVLFSRNPQSLEEALQILTEGNYLEYRNRKSTEKVQSKKPQILNHQKQYNPQNSNNYPRPWYNQNSQNNFQSNYQHNFPRKFQNNQNSVQTRIRRFGRPEPMEVDSNSEQFVQTNANFRINASENNQDCLISE